MASSQAAALREDQVQNAISFLAHPNVSPSPPATKRSFLERKGLTAAEIDEAFRRVPGSNTESTSSTATLSNVGSGSTSGTVSYLQAGQNAAPSSSQPLQTRPTPPYLSGQGSQPGASPSVYATAGLPALAPAAAQQPAAPPPLRWSQVVLGAVAVAGAAYAAFSVLVPRLRGAYHRWAEATAQRQAEERARAEQLEAAVKSLAGLQDELRSSSKDIVEAAAALRDAAAASKEASSAAAAVSAGHTAQMQKLSLQLQQLVDARPPSRQAQQQRAPGNAGGYSNGAASYQPERFEFERFDHAPHAAGSSPHYSYGYGLEATQGSEQRQRQAHAYYGSSGGMATPPYTATSSAVASPKQLGSANGAASSMGMVAEAHGNGHAARQAPPAPAGPPPTYPPAFSELVEMVAAGITPPNVRTDINDVPPDPTRPLSAPRMAPRPKPWEVAPQNFAAASPTEGVFAPPGAGAGAGAGASSQHSYGRGPLPASVDSFPPRSSSSASLASTGGDAAGKVNQMAPPPWRLAVCERSGLMHLRAPPPPHPLLHAGCN